MLKLLFKNRKPWYVLVRSHEIPSKIKNNEVYIIGEKYKEWLLIISCPCGCNDVIQLNTLEECSPVWRLSKKGKYVTIFPSIDRIVGCRSHFSIKRGNVEWFKDY